MGNNLTLMGGQHGTCCKTVTGCEESLFEVDRVETFVEDTARQLHIIFDWDDTLMCSSEVKAHRNPSAEEMRLLEEAVDRCLRTAIKLGKTTIVTNANLCWVRATAGLFMPSILPLLEVIDIVSARQEYEAEWPGNPTAWKREAFKDLVCPDSRPSSQVLSAGLDFVEDITSVPSTGSNASNASSPVNLVVLGDSTAEIQAGKSAVQSLNDSESIVKTVKFKETPTVADLLGQLQTVTRDLRNLAAEQKSISKQLVHGSLSGWSLCDEGRLTAATTVLHCL